MWLYDQEELSRLLKSSTTLFKGHIHVDFVHVRNHVMRELGHKPRVTKMYDI